MSSTLVSLAREDIPTIVFLRRQKLMSFLKAKKSNNSYGRNGTGMQSLVVDPIVSKLTQSSSHTPLTQIERGLGMGLKHLTYMKERHENGQSQQPQVCVQKNSL